MTIRLTGRFLLAGSLPALPIESGLTEPPLFSAPETQGGSTSLAVTT